MTSRLCGQRHSISEVSSPQCICADKVNKHVNLCKVVRSIAPLERNIAWEITHVFSEVAKVVDAFVFVGILLLFRLRWDT